MKRIIVSFVFAVFALMMGRFALGQTTMVGGAVYEMDSITPIVGASVTFSGFEWDGDTLVFQSYQFVTDTLGQYGDSIGFGVYWVWAAAEGYDTAYIADSLLVEEGMTLTEINFFLSEIVVPEPPYLQPVNYVAARQFANDLVRISWSMNDPLLYEDFETGDFDRFNWNNTLSNYPWAIDSIHAYEGNYCMKSTCEGVSEGISQIEVPVYVPTNGQMSFYSKVSSENHWDAGRFYLDGVKKLESSGDEDWTEHRFDITEGEHLFCWTYVKDSSSNVGEDCFYVDRIHFLEDSSNYKRATLDPVFLYYDLFRCRLDEAPVMLASHLSDTMFMEMNWNALLWGKYRWGVSCYYEDGRGNSDTIWSVFLDKDMTTSLNITATTNVGLIPAGADVLLSSHDTQNHSYHGTMDANGHLVLPEVYRGEYDLRVHLDGFMDYVSDESISIFAPTQLELELMEATIGIDSLYVSSTGWATWQLGTPQYRDLQYYELKLNGSFLGAVSSTSYMFDVSDLNDGDICVAQVRPVYLSGVCDWFSCTWVYHSCSDFQGSSNGLQWSLQNETLQLSWTYPENESFLGAVIYREGEYLGFAEGNTFFDETVGMHGEVVYGLRLVYDGPKDGTYHSMSCMEYALVSFSTDCDPPVKLDAEVYYENDSDYGALISWGERPEPIYQWLHYDDGTFKRALGGDNEPIIFWSIRFRAEDLADYMGCSLKKISIFDVGAGTYQLWIYVGGESAPRTLVRSQNMTLTNAHAWHEEAIDPPFDIPENEPLWIVVGQQGLNRPAAACADMGDPDGRWVSLDGVTWTDLHTFNMHYTWMLRALVSNPWGHAILRSDEGYDLQYYKLYRSYHNYDYQYIATVPIMEGQVYYEYRDPLVNETNDYFYYRLTAVYLSDEGEECESDCALALDNPNHNYVMIDLWSTEEKVMTPLNVYPNPAKGVMTIEAEGIRHVVVMNVLGQRIVELETDSNAVQLDLSDYDSGVYLLQVVTENGVMGHRIIVSR